MSKSGDAVGADELMKELLADPDYVERVRVAEEERNARAQVLRNAEQPIISDLRAAGVDVSSVWDLVNTAVPYPNALPILLEHLERGGYPDRVMESMARALAVKPAVFAWDRLLRLYLQANGSREVMGLGVALRAIAKKEHVDTLIGLVKDEARGETRGLFIGPILRYGGERGLQVIESLRNDALVGKEATALLKRRGR